VRENVYPADGRRVLLLASYCGDDNPNCCDKRPCPECLAMDNVAIILGGQIAVLGSFDSPSSLCTLGVSAPSPPVAGSEVLEKGKLDEQ
jgi:hypothetical protein